MTTTLQETLRYAMALLDQLHKDPLNYALVAELKLTLESLDNQVTALVPSARGLVVVTTPNRFGGE